jgi:hypothetical protein
VVNFDRRSQPKTAPSKIAILAPLYLTFPRKRSAEGAKSSRECLPCADGTCVRPVGWCDRSSDIMGTFSKGKKVDVNQSQQMTSQLLLFSIQYCREGVQVVITRLAVFDSQQSKYNQIPAGERSLSEKHLKSRKYNADSGFNFTCRPHSYFVLGSSSTASYSQKNLMKY